MREVANITINHLGNYDIFNTISCQLTTIYLTC